MYTVVNDKFDLDELKKTGDSFRKYFTQTTTTERQPIRVFLALLDLVIENIESGNELSETAFFKAVVA